MKFEWINETLIFRRAEVKTAADKKAVAELVNMMFHAHCMMTLLDEEDISELLSEHRIARIALQIAPGGRQQEPFLKVLRAV